MNPGSTQSPRDAPPGAVLLAASAMGTRFELVLPDDGSTEAHRRSAAEAALAEIVDLDARLSLFRKDSLLAHLNREAQKGASGQPVRLDDDTFALLSICVDVWRDSNGAFDATVAPLMRQWGLHIDSVMPSAPPLPICGPDGCVIPTSSPTESAASSTPTARPNTSAIELDTTTKSVRFHAPITLDLGGIAKGFALDIAIRTLRDADIAHAFLQGGTSAIAALGTSRPNTAKGSTNSPWRVGITVPDDAAPNGTILVELTDMALCVSAHHGRTADGHGHIIDPVTSEPARSPTEDHTTEVAAVIVDLNADGTPEPTAWPSTHADAWTKPVLLQGARPEGIPQSMTTLTATSTTVTINGPHESRCTLGAANRS